MVYFLQWSCPLIGLPWRAEENVITRSLVTHARCIRFEDIRDPGSRCLVISQPFPLPLNGQVIWFQRTMTLYCPDAERWEFTGTTFSPALGKEGQHEFR